jgi:threonine aldolase
MYFASDNSGPVAPEVMAALSRANEGYAMPYGDDEIMVRVTKRLREIFEAPEAVVYLVTTGSAANALLLATLTKPWQAVFCHRVSHVEEDECGASEFFTGGAKLVLLDGEAAKIDPDGLAETLRVTADKGVHGVQRGPLSITQATELGTIYSLEEIRALTALAKGYDLPCHMDGARFANALVTLGCTPAEMTWKAGIDVVSFGGTKNGLMGVEAVIFFDPRHAWEFELRRKRGAHLLSKHRYLSAQMEAYLANDLWLKLAGKANAAAAKLEAGILGVDGGMMQYQRQANMLFAGWPRAGHRRARAAGAAYYLWPFSQAAEGPENEVLTARLVCNWATTDEDIGRFLELIG